MPYREVMPPTSDGTALTAPGESSLAIRSEVAGEVLHQVSGIILNTIDEAGLATPEDGLTESVESGRSHDPSVVTQGAFPIEDGHVEPTVVRTEAGGPDDRADLAAREVEVES